MADALLPLAEPPLDPSSGEGRRLLADELSKAEYGAEESLLRRAVRGFIDWFLGLFDGAAGESISTWWVVAIVGGLLLVLALALWAAIRLQPGRRVGSAPQGGVFEEVGISAAEYRRRAGEARRRGDLGAAVLDAYRAIAAGAVERFILEDLPGATAREIAVALGGSFPDEATSLGEAARSFDAVRYGGESVSASSADRLLALEERLTRAVPRLEVPA